MRNKMKTTAEEEQVRPALVPKLRFPDFQDAREWEVSTIGDSKPFVTSGSRGWAPFYSENGDLFVRITNLLRDSIYLDLTDSKYVQLPPGANEGVRTQLKEHDVLISITADIGIIGYVDECIPSPAYINQHIALVRFDEEQLCGKYVAYFLAAEKSQKLFRASTDTGTKAGMSLIGIQKIVIIFPGLPEQQKIAECLSSVDELLAAQARKVDALKTHKKGLMQQLFPRDDETQPRLRFPEFQNAGGEWEPTSLGGVARLRNGYAFKSADYVVDGPYQIITIANVQQASLAIESTKRMAALPSDIQQHQILSLGDILISMTGNVGRVCRVTAEGLLLNQRVGQLVPEEIDAAFFYQLLQRDEFRNTMQLKAAGGAQGNLSGGDITQYAFSAPTEPDEQQRIASCLSSLDALITAEIQKHEALKIHKKGLMQQLFPSSEEYEP